MASLQLRGAWKGTVAHGDGGPYMICKRKIDSPTEPAVQGRHVLKNTREVSSAGGAPPGCGAVRVRGGWQGWPGHSLGAGSGLRRP